MGPREIGELLLLPLQQMRFSSLPSLRLGGVHKTNAAGRILNHKFMVPRFTRRSATELSRGEACVALLQRHTLFITRLCCRFHPRSLFHLLVRSILFSSLARDAVVFCRTFSHPSCRLTDLFIEKFRFRTDFVVQKQRVENTISKVRFLHSVEFNCKTLIK